MQKTRQKRILFFYFVLAYLVVVVAFTIYRYADESRRLELLTRSRLQNGAALVKYVMPDNYFDRAVKRFAISQAEYDKYVEALSRATWENQFRFLFALKFEDNKFYYIAFSQDRKAMGERKTIPYWMEYTDAPPQLSKAWKLHKTVYARQTDQDGSYYTILAPEYSPGGEYYMVGAEYDFRNIKKNLNGILIGAILQGLVLLVLLFLIYITLSHLQKHYIRRLQFSNAVNEASPIGVMSLQPGGTIDYVNQAFCDLLGVSHENLDAKNINGDLGFNHDAELVNRIRICLQRQISWQGEFLNVSLEGKEYWVNANINYLQPQQTGKGMVNVFASDVSTQVKARISLGQHNKVLNYLSQAIHTLLANPDINQTLPEVLSQYGQNLGKSQVAILRHSQNSYEVCSSWLNSGAAETGIPVNLFSQIRQPSYQDWENSLQEGQVVSGESYEFPVSLITLARVQSPGIIYICPIFCADQYWGFFLSLQTQREETMDTELEHTLMLSLADSIGSALQHSEIDQALRESVETKSGFMSSMSHEIRTPLNGVIGMINLLESTPLTPDQKDYVEAMKSSGRLLLNLINNILDITRIETGKTLLRQDPFSITSCVTNAVNVVSYELREKRLQLDTRFDDKLPVIMQGDETRLKQILVNLLHNSIKFTDQGVLKLSAERSGPSTVRFTVSDPGIGIEPEQLQHIFEPFYQAGPISQRMKGTGLGLSITRQLVELMNGEIRAESQPGRGTTISFSISQPILEDSPQYAETHPEQAGAISLPLSGELSALQTVFLAGGDLDDKILQNYLFSRGYNHATVNSWQNLTDRLQDPLVKLAVINLRDSDPNRPELVQQIRKAYHAWPGKFWLILTTRTVGEIIDPDPMPDNVQGLPKPLDFDQTLLYLQNVLGKGGKA